MGDSSEMQGQKKLFDGIPMAGVVVMIVALVGLRVDSSGAGGDNYYYDMERMDKVATKIHQNYVDEVSSKDLVDNAIKGMTQILDPHTSYFEPKEYEDLRMQTEGKFGGLGMQVSIRDKVLTVMTPISGTPAYRAGIQSGDQIIRIDGVSTRGTTTDKAVMKLRGEPGTEVKLLIRRRGEAQDMEYVIKRDIIHIKSVPFYGVLDNDIGYVTLQQFSQEAGAEVEKAIKELVKKNIKGLVFDLRHNPGGLLPQAIEVSEKFLPTKKLVVSTRGRMRSQNKEYFSGAGAVLPMDIPLVILVDRASASASEIVAGAVQDWDRGIILGDTTFGKGSVQSILQIDAANHLKITTAFYYTPAGRCINRPENFVRKADDFDEEDGEEAEGVEDAKETDAAKKDKTKADTATYRTNGGRLVFGGGGIVPDTVVQRKVPEAAIRALLLKDMFFQFANNEYVKLQKRGVKLTADYQPDSATLKAFYAHLDSVKFTFQSIAQLHFEEFKKRSGIIEDTALKEKDKTNPYIMPPKFGDAEFKSLTSTSARVDSILAEDSRQAIRRSETEIKRLIRDALLVRVFGQDNEAVFRSKLANDEQFAAAASILHDRNSYAKLLKAPAVQKPQQAAGKAVAPTQQKPADAKATGQDNKKGNDKKGQDDKKGGKK